MIKIKFLWSLALIGIFAPTLRAQKQYNEQENYLKANRVWAFGTYAGLDFNSGKPVPIQTGATSLEGTASACDPQTGALLFYVVQGGWRAYNRNHQRMPHGDSLIAYGGYANNQSTAQTCIVPVIDSPGIYYVFTVPESFGYDQAGGNPAGLSYSIIDMSLDNGLGDVRTGQKKISLNTGIVSEALIAIPGNNCDIWLMAHKRAKHEFIAFHITKDGIDPNYVLSAPTGPDTNYYYLQGNMYVSPNRERIYTTAGKGIGGTIQCLLYKFNPTTGKVYEPLIMENPKRTIVFNTTTSVAFSPDNSKLYMGNLDPGFNGIGYLTQFDISIYNPVAIDTSAYRLPYTGSGSQSGDPFGLRLYGDTIYVGGGRSGKPLSTIAHPNLRGAACGFDSASIPFLPGTGSGLGMCAEIVYPFMGTSTKNLALDTLICADEINLNLEAATGYKYYYWQDGYAGAKRQINNPGTYWVNGNMIGGEGSHDQDCDNRVDTFIIRGGNFPTPIITVNVFELSTTAVYDTYQWYFNGVKIPGATKRKLTVTQNGNYTVDVSSKEGCKALSDIYKVTNVTDNTGIPGFAGNDPDLRVYPNPTQDVLYVSSAERLIMTICSVEGKIIRKVENASSMSIRDLAAGMYILHLRDLKGRFSKNVKIIKCD